MSINDIGKEGESLARVILQKQMKVDKIFQADWLISKGNKWFVVEVKHKELYKSPPFDGQGLDVRQVNMRLNFYKDTGIRCLFLVIDKDTKLVYWQWLDKLEETKHMTTKNGIRIYNIEHFTLLK